jgi:site-specific recombinase XerD
VRSYRDTLKLFFAFAAERLHKPVAALGINDLDWKVVLAFLDHLERERANAAATRNTRLAALHVFYRHVAAQEPRHLDLCQRALAVPFKRTPIRNVDYLDRPELEAVLLAVDRTTANGRRDYALLSFLYNTGARVQEALDVHACDLQLDPADRSVRIWGKGRKERLLPLWPQTAKILRDLLTEKELDPRGPSHVFTNQHGRALTRFGVRHILRKYVGRAASKVPSLANKAVHPHTIRHSTAVHMLHSGIDLGRIASQLGHANLTTTGHYAKISLELKRRSMAACAPKATAAPQWKRDKDLLDWLRQL